jgi:predicted N-acetyltransferase YhbS
MNAEQTLSKRESHADLVPLDACNAASIEALLDAAFGADRKERTAYKLREGVGYLPKLSFGLMTTGALIGSIQCWPVQLETPQCPLILVGPVAVAPDQQGLGYGHTLMHATLDAAAREGDPVMVMIGDPEYYQRFGFYAEAAAHWTLPAPWEPRRLLVRNIAKRPLPKSGLIGPDMTYAL